MDYADCRAATEARPSDPNKLFCKAMARAGLFASRQGPCGLPAAFAARSRPTPRRRSSAKRARPRFHCFQAMARNRRLVRFAHPSPPSGWIEDCTSKLSIMLGTQ